MTIPTYDDAALIVQLAQWASASGAEEASNWMFSAEFTPDYGGAPEAFYDLMAQEEADMDPMWDSYWRNQA